MINFIGNRKIWFFISGVMLLASLFSFAYNGMVKGSPMNFGIDFTGGTMLNLRFPEGVSEAGIRKILAETNLEKSVIQKTAKNDVFIRTVEIDRETRLKIVDSLKEKYGDVELLEADTIGPVMGNELRGQALWAFLIASIGIIIYVSFRFEFKYAVAGLIALYHDAIIAAGVMALLWRNVEIPFIAAILTIMGYSINDTIVVFDRIRENSKAHGASKKKFTDIVNVSINETMGRSINTTLTTLIVVLCVLFFGGETLKDFALVLLVGFSVGAYSSIFVASPIVALWESKRK